MLPRIIIFFTLILVFEFLALRSLLKLVVNEKKRKKLIRCYCLVSGSVLSATIAYYIYNQLDNVPDYVQFRNFFNISAIFVLNMGPKMVLSIFSIIDDAMVFVIFIFSVIRRQKIKKMPLFTVRKVILMAGVVLGLILFGNTIYGMVWGKSDIEIKRVNISSTKLPASFDGFRIAQISDYHLGSFKNNKAVKDGLASLIAEKPDVIVFTGDMVNNVAKEATSYIPLFKELKPPYGMYSVLGNHDMGDYRRWYNQRDKTVNLQDLVKVQEEMGFKMLRNKHTYIVKGNDSIALIGVDNWGKPPFKKYGDLTLATKGLAPNLFTILLSHDPSHWALEVKGNPVIDLTLSGHTHGAQFVAKIGTVRYSPVQMMYENWMGLYNYGTQFLYVNTGLGFIGFPGRIGVKPEITIFTLKAL